MVCEYIVLTDSPSALTEFPVKPGDVGKAHATWLARLGRKSGARAPFFAPGNISAGFILEPREETFQMQALMRSAWLWTLLLLLSHAALGLDPQRSLDHYGHQGWR